MRIKYWVERNGRSAAAFIAASLPTHRIGKAESLRPRPSAMASVFTSLEPFQRLGRWIRNWANAALGCRVAPYDVVLVKNKAYREQWATTPGPRSDGPRGGMRVRVDRFAIIASEAPSQYRFERAFFSAPRTLTAGLHLLHGPRPQPVTSSSPIAASER